MNNLHFITVNSKYHLSNDGNVVFAWNMWHFRENVYPVTLLVIWPHENSDAFIFAPGNRLFFAFTLWPYRAQTGHNGTNDQISVLTFLSNKPDCRWSFPVTSFVFFLSLFSGPTLHHFNSSTSTERHWRRAERSPSTIVTQRATSRSILWDPLWCRACICWLVNQRTSALLGRITPTVPIWALSKDKRTNRRRLLVKSWTGTLRVLWQSTSFFMQYICIDYCEMEVDSCECL